MGAPPAGMDDAGMDDAGMDASTMTEGSGETGFDGEAGETGDPDERGEDSETGDSDQRGDSDESGEPDDRGEPDESGGSDETGDSDETGGSDESGEPGSTGEPVAICGDGRVGGDEACDDAGESTGCNADCSLAACGDGIRNATAGEECDGVVDNAACSAACLASCNPDFADCNGDLDLDGCETVLGTQSDCEACADVCAAEQTCLEIGCATVGNYGYPEYFESYGVWDGFLYGTSVFFVDEAWVTSLSFITSGTGGSNAQMALYDQNLALVVETGWLGPYTAGGPEDFEPTTYELAVEPTMVAPGEYWVVAFFDQGSIVGSSPPGTGAYPNILTAPQPFDDGFPATITNAAIGTNVAPNIFATAAL